MVWLILFLAAARLRAFSGERALPEKGSIKKRRV